MTAPRQILQGACYLVTRRCSQRQFLLKPSQTTNEAFLYLLAVAARRHTIGVHAFCVLSNHFHLVVTDPGACLPDFLRYLNGLVARALNVSLDREESFWAPDTFSAVRLLSPRDIVDKAAYTLANPVAAGLVRSGRQWPGLWSAPESIGGSPIVAKRPGFFFSPKGRMPKSISLQLTAPSGFASAAAFREALVAALLVRERSAVRASSGFLGILKVRSQLPTARPRSRVPRGGLSPRIASRDKWKRIEALGQLKEFIASYRAAWREWLTDRKAVFPAGTYQMRVVHGVVCEGAG
jgi:REP element-mobilizing transposase RayT